MNLRIVLILGIAALLGLFYATVFRQHTELTLLDEKYAPVGDVPLYDPQMAPENIRDLVMKGFSIFMETKRHLPEYAGDIINCRNCHFNAGNSFGGRSEGFSLVGVDHKYPRQLKSGEEYTLRERINSCFLRSLNGKPLPLDHPGMDAMIAYLEWISHGVPKHANTPWLGMKEIRSNHTPDPKNGAEIYQVRCAECHGLNGEGQKRPYELDYPPLWGENAFNDGAGMNRLNVFAYFVYENMPYNQPSLTYEEALDVGAFVTSQKRPIFRGED